MRATDEIKAAILATKRNPHLSKDGKWRSFSKVPNLLQ
jgi:hypothetical protein